METFTFRTNIILFWLKGVVTVDSRMVKTTIPNTVMRLIPAGVDNQNIPLKNISGSIISSRILLKPIIIGLILFMIGFSTIADSFIFGTLFSLLGLASISNGIVTELIIEKSGSAYIISVPFFEKAKMRSLSSFIQKALEDDTDKTDLNMFFDKKEQAKTV